MVAFISLLALALGLAIQAGPTPASLLPNQEGLLGVLSTQSAKPLKPGAMVLGGAGLVINDLSTVDGGYSTLAGKKKYLEDCLISSNRFHISLGLGGGLDISLVLPVYYESITGFPTPAKEAGTGDPTLFLKYALPIKTPFASFNIFSASNAPTASKKGILPKGLEYIPQNGGYPDSITKPMGLKYFGLKVGLGTTLDFSGLNESTEALLHFNLTAWRPLTPNTVYPFGILGSSLAAEFSPLKNFRLQTEFKHEFLLSRISDLNQPQAQTATLSLGMGLALGRSLSLQAGTILAPPAWNPVEPLKLKTTKGEQKLSYRIYPTASLFLTLDWQFFPLGRDSDQDGVPDGKDNCSFIPEDLDGFQDLDGCPDGDNDVDGIPDALDRCPYVSEDFDGYEDSDGCPDVDNDRDGIMEKTDQCPNDPEDIDNYQDQDGCPDLDNDGDGILDVRDKCPLAAENFNGVKDQDGCPEQDRDGDGIADPQDKCPTEKEITNFYEDEDGCPDQKPEPIREGILNGVDFLPGTADLLSGANEVLNALVIRLKAYPGTEIEILAHVDDQAGPLAQSLTEARAEAVADNLNQLGIDLGRIKRTGCGYSQPRTSNRTAKGREMNRRIEIRRLN
jgi:outer membrane protein OmpA-like peptidoglycan-associated protein